MLNFDKDQRLLFQCRPFSNQWPAVFGNVIQIGVALLLAGRERVRGSERVEHRTSRAADFHEGSVTLDTCLHTNEFSPQHSRRSPRPPAHTLRPHTPITFDSPSRPQICGHSPNAHIM